MVTFLAESSSALPPARIRRRRSLRYVDYVEQFTRGVDALQAGQQREAERVFERLVRLFPGSYEVHQYLGRTRAARGAHDDALREFETARRLSPESALVAFDAAKSLAAKRALRRGAGPRDRRSHARSPTRFTAMSQRARCCAQPAQRAEARGSVREGAGPQPGPRPRRVRARRLSRRRRRLGRRRCPLSACAHERRGMVEARAALEPRGTAVSPRGVDDERPHDDEPRRGRPIGRRLSRAVGRRSGDRAIAWLSPGSCSGCGR